LNYAWSYMATYGVPSWNCYPYQAGSGNAPPCVTACPTEGEDWVVYKAGDAEAIAAPGPG